jgi:hypothetical protein
VCELFPLHSGNVRHFENFIHFIYMHTIEITLPSKSVVNCFYSSHLTSNIYTLGLIIFLEHQIWIPSYSPQNL